MSVSIEIVPYTDSLDMYGQPSRSEAYSLSGYVSLSISPSVSFFERRRAVNLLLQSLVITFEGQTELVTEETGYTAVRLCSLSQELTRGEPVELSNEGHEDSDKPCTWNIVFNLTVPGWLPATAIFGDREAGDAGVCYALHAVAKFDNIDESNSRSWFSTLCNPFRPISRVLAAPKCPIHINRFMSPSSYASSSTSPFPLANYHVSAQPDRSDPENDNARIPPDVLSKLRIITAVPESISSDDASIPFTLKVRTTDLTEHECKRLRLEEFSIDVEQTERYRSSPSSAYMAAFPVPSRKEQPPNKPLLSPHPVQTVYELGLASLPQTNHVLSRTFSILSEDVSGRYMLSGDGYIFAQDAASGQETSWFSMKTSVPITGNADDRQGDDSWKYIRRLRETSQSPLFGVSHRMHITLMCTYDLTEGENPKRAKERLQFSIPLHFVHLAPSSPMSSRSSSPPPSVIVPGSTSYVDLPLPSLPYAQSLPAYSQLFDSNGDRKIDYSIPLPLYTPLPTQDIDVDFPSADLDDESD
ncbi:hypothetical protein C8Q75DRAFT_728852 [Abortiporus biennis]|nr:hypothetical protein C8Q75DRAFT_728852 [Abortiporus biennis]